MNLTPTEYRRMTGKKPAGAFFQPSRTDENQADIVTTFRKLGYSVTCTHRVGNGAFDLVIAKHGLNVWVEVKNGLKPPSGREYTKDQREWNFIWQGMRCVVTCKAECLAVDRQIAAILKSIHAAGIALQVVGNSELQYQPRLS